MYFEPLFVIIARHIRKDMSSAPLILHLETATKVCSVALSQGNSLLATLSSEED